MSNVWNRIYKLDDTFFGEEPSNFARICLEDMKTNSLKKVLELGAGYGRDALFFASNDIQIDAVDYSITGIELLSKRAKEKRLNIKIHCFDVKQSLPFPDNHFDAVYSHMLFNMKFSQDGLSSIFSEIRRVLKPRGLNFFSVRNNHDKFYGKGIEIEKGVYKINDFEIRFFTERDLHDLISSENFKIVWIKEDYEEPVTLYLVSTIKLDKN